MYMIYVLCYVCTKLNLTNLYRFYSSQGNMFDGSRGLTFKLFKQFNKWFLELGTPEGLYAAGYATTTLNLACRGDSTGNVCTKHIKHEDDCVSISFSHIKEEQLGDNPTKRLPRHIYYNPWML